MSLKEERSEAMKLVREFAASVTDEETHSETLARWTGIKHEVVSIITAAMATAFDDIYEREVYILLLGVWLGRRET